MPRSFGPSRIRALFGAWFTYRCRHGNGSPRGSIDHSQLGDLYFLPGPHTATETPRGEHAELLTEFAAQNEFGIQDPECQAMGFGSCSE
jgi:hypothetical protein